MVARTGDKASLTMDEKRRLVRRLLDREGRGFAEASGFLVSNSPSNLYTVLYLSMLAGGRRDHRTAARLTRALRDAFDSAMRMADAGPDRVREVLRGAGMRAGSDRLAGTLTELAGAVADRYRGDLRRLRTEARRDATRERQLLAALPGIDNRAVDLFFREVQVIWPEIKPFVDRRALTAANRLGLGRDARELTAMTGDESEKLAWLAGALARVDEDGSYAEVAPLAYPPRRR